MKNNLDDLQESLYRTKQKINRNAKTGPDPLRSNKISKGWNALSTKTSDSKTKIKPSNNSWQKKIAYTKNSNSNTPSGSNSWGYS